MKEYFSHDYEARGDEKIKRLLFVHSWIGYGIYWAIIETLYQNSGYLILDYESIAFDMRTDKNIIDSIINDFDLFKIKGKKFYSESVLRRLNERKEKSENAKRSALIRWNKGDNKHADALPTQSDSNANKGKKRKLKEKKEFIPPSMENVKKYFIDNSYKEEIAIKMFNFYSASDWIDTRGNKISNWKQKAIKVWFKEENKEKKIDRQPG
jgi:hypothetical protein